MVKITVVVKNVFIACFVFIYLQLLNEKFLQLIFVSVKKIMKVNYAIFVTLFILHIMNKNKVLISLSAKS